MAMATAKGNEAVLQATKLKQNLRQGCRVELTGLSSKDLNGQRGTISGSFNVDQKRWPLVVDGTGRKLSCKPANLRGLADVKNDAEYMWVALSTDYPTTVQPRPHILAGGALVHVRHHGPQVHK